jgi:transposase-like protein
MIKEVPQMKQDRIMIRSLPEAMAVVKEMNIASSEEWTGDYRGAARDAISSFLTDRMTQKLRFHLAEREAGGIPDRRNGHYMRHLLTELGDVLVSVPRTRTYNPVEVIRAYARRSQDVDRLILASFLLGLSTRKVGEALLSILGEKVSPATVSRVAKTLDKAVSAFHRRRLKGTYRALLFDGVVLTRKTGAGPVKRPVLVALGIRHDGKKEIIDFRLARSESADEWESFLTRLTARGLSGRETEVVCVDGGPGLISAVRSVYPLIPLQRCWAHKMRNILDKVRKADTEEVKRGLVRVYGAKNLREARSAAKRWSTVWEDRYPAAVKCLRDDLDDLLTCFGFADKLFRRKIRTTNAIERVFREVRRRTRPMGVFENRTSMERILYAVFLYENIRYGVHYVFAC